jgi:hypothetical protein
MEKEPFDAKTGPDRFATSEEIRAALILVPDALIPWVPGGLWEVASDLGGHVLIDSETTLAFSLLETLDATVN